MDQNMFVADASLSHPPAMANSILLEFVMDLCLWTCLQIFAQYLRLTVDFKLAQQFMQEVFFDW